MKIDFWVADTCLPDYWQGSGLPYVQVVVRHATTVSEFYDELADELRFHGPQSHDVPGRFVDACLEAVVAHKAALLDVGFDLSQPYDASLEPVPEDYDGDEVYAYVIFQLVDITHEEVLDLLWDKVRQEGSMVSLDAHTTARHTYGWDDDDEAMRDAPSDDLGRWVDDVEARLGGMVADWRAAVIDYCCIRDGEDAGFEWHEVEYTELQLLEPMGWQS